MSLEAWRALALVGTARTGALPAAPHAVLEPWFEQLRAKSANTDDARRALDAAALIAVATTAGFAPRRDVVPSEVAPAETRAIAAPAAASILRRILRGEQDDSVSEWCRLAARAQWLVPPQDLHALLERVRREPGLAKGAAMVLGERGHWLARRHAAYAALVTEPQPLDFEFDSGTPAQRLAWLEQRLVDDHASAAAALVATWGAAAGEEREVLLGAVAERPIAELEDLLETRALADRRANVRFLARRALARLPSSRFSVRARERADALLALDHDGRLVLDPPPTFDPAWTKDAVEKRPPPGVGERAAWARQLLGVVPIQHWCDRFGLEATALFRANCDVESKDVIARAFVDSLCVSAQPAVAVAFAEHAWLADRWPTHVPARAEFGAEWLRALPESVASDVARVLATRAREDQLLTELIVQRGIAAAPTEPAVVAAAVDQVLEHMPARSDARWIRALGTWVPAAALTAVHTRIEARESLTSVAEGVLRVLDFRLELQRAFPAPTAP